MPHNPPQRLQMWLTRWNTHNHHSNSAHYRLFITNTITYMKLTNHKKSNYYNLPDGTTIRGTITLTDIELQKSLDYLYKQYKKALTNNDTYTRDELLKINEYDKKGVPQILFSIGVHATKLLAKHYKLTTYKDQNYALYIK